MHDKRNIYISEVFACGRGGVPFYIPAGPTIKVLDELRLYVKITHSHVSIMYITEEGKRVLDIGVPSRF